MRLPERRPVEPRCLRKLQAHCHRIATIAGDFRVPTKFLVCCSQVIHRRSRRFRRSGRSVLLKAGAEQENSRRFSILQSEEVRLVSMSPYRHTAYASSLRQTAMRARSRPSYSGLYPRFPLTTGWGAQTGECTGSPQNGMVLVTLGSQRATHGIQGLLSGIDRG
jgi:hypothetical protein